MSESQILIVGLVASAIVWALKVGMTYLNAKPSRIFINTVLFGVSLALGFVFLGASAPVFPICESSDIVGCANGVWLYINSWVSIGASVMGSAGLIYNLLYEKVFAGGFAKLMSLKRKG